MANVDIKVNIKSQLQGIEALSKGTTKAKEFKKALESLANSEGKITDEVAKQVVSTIKAKAEKKEQLQIQKELVRLQNQGVKGSEKEVLELARQNVKARERQRIEQETNKDLVRRNNLLAAELNAQTRLNNAKARAARQGAGGGGSRIRPGAGSVGGGAFGGALGSAAGAGLRSLGGALLPLAGLAGIVVGLQKTAQAITTLSGVALTASKNVALLRTAFGEDQLPAALGFLDSEAKRTNQTVNDLAVGYSKLALAAKDSNIGLEGAQVIYTGLNTAVSALNLSTDEAAGIQKAFEQSISKGRVQAEELRGQLGDRLPGAFSLFAKSLDLSAEELNVLLENGKLGSETLIDFARELQKEYGDALARKLETTAGKADVASANFKNLFIQGVSGGSEFNKELDGLFNAFVNLSENSFIKEFIGDLIGLFAEIIGKVNEGIKVFTGFAAGVKVLVRDYRKLIEEFSKGNTPLSLVAKLALKIRDNFDSIRTTIKAFFRDLFKGLGSVAEPLLKFLGLEGFSAQVKKTAADIEKTFAENQVQLNVDVAARAKNNKAPDPLAGSNVQGADRAKLQKDLDDLKKGKEGGAGAAGPKPRELSLKDELDSGLKLFEANLKNEEELLKAQLARRQITAEQFNDKLLALELSLVDEKLRINNQELTNTKDIDDVRKNQLITENKLLESEKQRALLANETAKFTEAEVKALEDLETKLDIIATKEEILNNLKEQGGSKGAEAERELLKLAKERIALEISRINLLETQGKLNAEFAEAQRKALQSQSPKIVSELQTAVKEGLKQSIAQTLDGILVGTISFKEGLQNILLDLAETVRQKILEKFTNNLIDQAFEPGKGILAGLFGGSPAGDSEGKAPETGTASTDKAVAELLAKAGNSLKGGFDGIVSTLGPLVSQLGTAFTSLFPAIGQLVSSFVQAAAQIIAQAVKAAATGGLGFSTGGFVSGPGTGTSDSIPARLSNGEFVLRAAAVRNLGVGFLSDLNRTGRVPGFSTGGLVGTAAGINPAVNIGNNISMKAINVVDKGLLGDFIATPGGEKLLLNFIRKNGSEIKQLL